MNRITFSICLIGLGLFAATAQAFHHHGGWQLPADGRAEVPGAGGLYYTGSDRDLGLRCSTCHVEPEQTIRANIDFSPPLNDGRYSPEQRYAVRVRMTGEHRGLMGCSESPITPNRNSMNAMFVGRDGNPIGEVAPDEGGRRCGERNVNASSSQTTVVFGDCNAVVGAQSGLRSLDEWTFSWRAPGNGSGDVTLWVGVVDGDCVFDSLNDDVFETRMTLAED